MCIKTAVLLSCFIAVSFAVDEHRQKIEELRGKRNLEYTISHHYPPSKPYRLERRISAGPQLPRYNPYFPGPRPYSSYRKGRPHSLPAPPYAVQMEPLVQYSQRDPLYDTNTLSLIADNHNELAKPEDLLTENNHIAENVYGPPKHYAERPVYIKEPEPIIEIIIKESNVTLPPVPVPVVTPAPKKKEQVQVFYVKYKKNPNGYGKDSVIYDKPIPALNPVVHEETEEPPHSNYEPVHFVTSAPPPSTTLRTIIKPDSEVYHGPSGIKVTFGKESFDHDKRSSKNDDENEESAPQPAVSHPQARQFPIQSFFQRRFPILNFQSGPNFRPEPVRQPQPYKPFTPPPPSSSGQYKQQSQFGRQYSQISPFSSQAKLPQRQQLPSKGPTAQFHSPTFSQKPAPPQFNQKLPSQQQIFNFNAPRQPVPYQPFEQLRPQQQTQFQFPPQTHFPVHQQLPLIQNHNVFNHQVANQQPPQHIPQKLHIPEHIQQQYQFHQAQPSLPTLQQNDFLHHNQQQQQQQHQIYQQQHSQEQFNQQQFAKPQQNHKPQNEFYNQEQQSLPQAVQQQQFNQQYNLNNLQFAQHVLPPGGELIHSLPKYEQHISVSTDSSQEPSALPLQQSNPLTPQQYQQQIQKQFNQNTAQPVESSTRQPVQQQQQYFIQNGVAIQKNSINFSNNGLPSNHKFYNTAEPVEPQQQTTRTNIYSSSTTPKSTYRTTTYRTTTSKPTEKPAETKTDNKALNIQLPDEVPEELRQQLLSSGILSNADISVLDYDKVGDIPLSALPPDQLANFYGAGGAQQLAAAGSAPIPSVITPEGVPVNTGGQQSKNNLLTQESTKKEAKVKPPVEMKVVHYDPKTRQGQQVQDSYVQTGATQIDPVVLNDQKYTRYLPLKVSGTQFPIPDVPELKGKTINSVVVLAPVDYDFQDNQRKARDIEVNPENIEYLLEGNALKDLIDNPSLENYQKFLEKQNNTSSDKQSVILLVVGNENKTENEKEIFMYDIATQTVNKLNGELSSAFVDAAESNANEETKPSSTPQLAPNNTEIIYAEKPISDKQDFPENERDLSGAASEYFGLKFPVVIESDSSETDASERLETFEGFSSAPSSEDLTAAASEFNSLENRVYINTGYSKTGYSLPST